MENGDHDDIDGMIEGVKITQSELDKAFEKHRIKKIEPRDVPFDHNHHQAMFEVETDAHPAGMVVELVQVGYILGDRLLRPAMVGAAV